ncbi:hypothetical protein M3936_24260, partial [Sutcliffiella horikoshii]|uniref:hypothetical protein n=1 Tax=Sutcliffiella horikoshii TaxID=79883 RepID=UPI00203D48FB
HAAADAQTAGAVGVKAEGEEESVEAGAVGSNDVNADATIDEEEINAAADAQTAGAVGVKAEGEEESVEAGAVGSNDVNADATID